MVKQRKTPEEDVDRLQERIWRRGRGKIKNKADFLSVYYGYMKNSPQKNDVDLQDKVFGNMQQRHKGLSSDIVGKRDRLKLFKRAGKTPSAKEFNTIGYQKKGGRQVYARRTVYKYKSRQITVFRDKKGRFVHVPKTSR